MSEGAYFGASRTGVVVGSAQPAGEGKTGGQGVLHLLGHAEQHRRAEDASGAMGVSRARPDGSCQAARARVPLRRWVLLVDLPGRDDILLSAALVLEDALIVKTLMHRWELMP